VIRVDEAKKNYKLDINHFPFSNMYPVFHVSALEPFYKLPKSSVPAPIRNKTIIHILGSKKQQNQYQYFANNQEWLRADIFDDNPHYAELLEDYQDFSYNQFIKK